jgi:hypothetical protein
MWPAEEELKRGLAVGQTVLRELSYLIVDVI